MRNGRFAHLFLRCYYALSTFSNIKSPGDGVAVCGEALQESFRHASSYGLICCSLATTTSTQQVIINTRVSSTSLSTVLTPCKPSSDTCNRIRILPPRKSCREPSRRSGSAASGLDCLGGAGRLGWNKEGGGKSMLELRNQSGSIMHRCPDSSRSEKIT